MLDRQGGPEGGAHSDAAHIRTFLIADVRGYTLYTQEHGDEAAAALASKFAAVARDGVEARGGVVVELRGDEALAVFDSARQAIRASVELQRRFVDETVAEPSLPLAVGIGLDAGEAVPVEGGYRGGALNLAARLCSLAGPAEILASPAVTHLARKVDGVAFVDRGSVRLKGLADPVTVIRLRAEADDAAEDIAFRRALGSRAVRLVPAVPDEMMPNPYKGLRAFEESDAADFFGREELLGQLVERLGETRFLAVVGPSGSGKSSVVRAGMIPALRRGAIPGSERWRIVDMFPGARPLEGLEAALLRSSPDPPPSLMEQLERDEHGLHRSILRLLPSDGSDLILLIDQFEELFTLVEDEAVRTHFLDSLEAAVTDPHSRLRVVTTLRADFYDRPLLYRGFAELFKSRVEAVIPLSPDELERAISGPARRVDVSLEPGLVAAMLADVAEEPGALPLMEYALTELFEHRHGRVLTLDAYREIGGLSAALGRRAEELYGELDEDGKEAARQLFLRLVALGEGTEDTRRRVFRSEVASLEVHGQMMASVIDAFGASRQLSFDRDTRTGVPTIELAHEAILTAWPRLHRWIDAAREDLRTERRLAAASADWIEAGRDASFLLSGSRLEQAEAWTASSGLAVTPEEREYLDASRAERDRQTADEEARRAHEEELERRSIRRLRGLVAVLAAAALVAATLTGIATNQRNQAEQASLETRARELALAADANLGVDPELSVLLATEAVKTTRAVDGTVLREAEEALHRALGAHRVTATIPDIGGADFLADGERLIGFVPAESSSEGDADEGAPRTAWIIDAATGEQLLSLEGHAGGITDVTASPSDDLVATSSLDGTTRIWDPGTGATIQVLGELGDPASARVEFSPDGGFLATGAGRAGRGLVTIWDTSSWRQVADFGTHLGGVVSMAWSPGSSRIAVVPEQEGPEDAPVAFKVWDASAGRPLGSATESRTLFGVEAEPYSTAGIVWTADGTSIVSANGSTYGVEIWDPKTGRRIGATPYSDIPLAVALAPDGSLLATGGAETVVVSRMTAEGPTLSLDLPSVSGGVREVSFSPDGARLAVASGAGVTRIWDVSVAGGAEVLNLPTSSFIPDVDFSADGRRLAISGRDRTIEIYDPDTGNEIDSMDVDPATAGRAAFYVGALDLDFSPGGDRLAFAYGDSGFIWAMGSGAPIRLGPVVGTAISGIDFSPKGQHVVTTHFDLGRRWELDAETATLRVWDAWSGAQLWQRQYRGDFPRWSAGDLITAGQAYSELRLWDALTGERLKTLIDVPTYGAAFSASGHFIAAALGDGSVRIWDVASGEELDTFSSGAFSVAFSPDGRRLATGLTTGEVRIWDVQTGRELLTLEGHRDAVRTLAFAPDGSRLASASYDATVRVWILDVDELIDVARERLTRTFTQQECRQYRIDPCPASV